jgi:hypothetical protein
MKSIIKNLILISLIGMVSVSVTNAKIFDLLGERFSKMLRRRTKYAEEVLRVPFGVRDYKKFKEIRKIAIIGASFEKPKVAKLPAYIRYPGSTFEEYKYLPDEKEKEEVLKSFVRMFTQKVIDSKMFNVVDEKKIILTFGDIVVPADCPAKIDEVEFTHITLGQRGMGPQVSKHVTIWEIGMLTDYTHQPFNPTKMKNIKEKLDVDGVLFIWIPEVRVSYLEKHFILMKIKEEENISISKFIVCATLYDATDGSEVWYGYNEGEMAMPNKALDLCCCGLPIPSQLIFTSWKVPNYYRPGTKNYYRFLSPYIPRKGRPMKEYAKDIIEGWIRYGVEKMASEFLYQQPPKITTQK